MLITYAQINTTPCDFEGNWNQILDAINQAKQLKSSILVTPESALGGYGVKDKIEDPNFIEKNLQYLQKVCYESLDYDGYIIVGYVERSTLGSGKRYRNAAAVIHKGFITAKYFKRLMPYGDVFEEGRHFEPGTEPCVIDMTFKTKNGTFTEKVGIAICEDMWNDKMMADYNHHNNPIDAYRKLGVKKIISLNSSPYVKDKPTLRVEMLKQISASFENGVEIIYCNQYGAQDELVFDGNSAYVRQGISVVIPPTSIFEQPKDKKHALGRIVTIETNGLGWFENGELHTDMKSLAKCENIHWHCLMLGLFDYVKKTGFKGVTLGSSGGIDSAVIVAMAASLFGGENVHAIRMPSCYSSKDSENLALELHKNLGVKDYLIPIDHEAFMHHVNCGLGLEEYVDTDLIQRNPRDIYKKKISYNEVCNENIQSRMRGTIVMQNANARGLLALGTCNKCEAACGYFTLFGDSANLFNPFIDCLKFEVYEFGRWLNQNVKPVIPDVKEVIPSGVVKRPPTAELRPDQTDESSLMPYAILDYIVKFYVEENVTTFDQYKWARCCSVTHSTAAPTSFDKYELVEAEYNRIIRLIEMNEFKRRLVAMGPKLTSKAFGTGRRVPVVKK